MPYQFKIKLKESHHENIRVKNDKNKEREWKYLNKINKWILGMLMERMDVFILDSKLGFFSPSCGLLSAMGTLNSSQIHHISLTLII